MVVGLVNELCRLKIMLLYLLSKKGLTSTMELRHYFKEVNRLEETVSKQNYFKRLQQLNPKVFRVLNRDYISHFYYGDEAVKWGEYLVFTIDGSKMEIPNSKENLNTYGGGLNQYGQSVARASFSGLYDVYNNFLLDIVISHNNSSEIESAKLHILALKEILGSRPVLLIFDRSYPSLEFIDFLEQSGVKYLMRLSSNDYCSEISCMPCSDGEVELLHSKSRLGHISKKYPTRSAELLKRSSTNTRIIKTIFKKDKDVILMTNIKDCSANAIEDLYLKRWSIESKYHTLKNKLKFESISGKASIYVEQDFWVHTLVFNIIQDIITRAEFELSKKSKDKEYKYKVRINENIAIGMFKEQFIQLMLIEDIGRKYALFENLISDIERNILPIRKLKGSSRKWNGCNKYKCNQKPSF